MRGFVPSLRKSACAVLVLTSNLAVAPPTQAEDLTLGPVYTESFPHLAVTLESWPGSDADGAVLPEPADLTLVEDDRPTARALSVEAFGDRGVAVVVAVDVSGTMQGAPLAATRRALTALLGEVGPHDRFALVSFADEARVEVGFDDPPETARAAIEGLSTRGELTQLYRALLGALDSFDTAGDDLPLRRRLIVLSDGWDEGEAYEADDVIAEARRRRVPVDAIGLTRVRQSELLNLERLAERTGGHYARAEGADAVEALFARGMERLASTPVATFAVATWSADGRPHRLGVLWQRGDRVLAGETRVALPPPAPANPAAGKGADRADEPPGWGDGWSWIAAAVAAAVVLALVLVAVARRRRAPEPLSPERPVEPVPDRSSRRHPPLASTAAEEVDRGSGGSGEAGVAAAAGSATAVTGGDAETAAPGVPPSARKTQLRTTFPAPAPGRPSAFLVAEGGAGRAFPIDRSPLWIGAAADTDLNLPDDDYLSSRHASIRFRKGDLLIHDNASTNGTFVNEERLAGPRPLAPGDRLRLGRSTFVLLREDEAR